jgi:superfamily II DNA/RNA helicase
MEKLFDANGKLIPIKDNTITMLTYEALYKIGFNEDTNREFINSLMRVLDDGSDSSKARDIAIKIEKAETTLGKVQAGTLIDFDHFDFDYICIDEAHNFKNIFTTVKGEESEGSKQYEITGSVSTRGLKAFFITQYINLKHKGNVMLLTATPFTNNPLEVYSMLALCAFPELKKRGISSLREFFDTYVKQTYEVVYGSDFQFKERAVIKSWNNRISLQQLIFSFINHKSGEEAGIQRPNKIVLPLFRANVDGAIVDLPEDQQISTFLAPTADQRTYLKDIESFVLKESTLGDIGSFCNFDGIDEECTANDNFSTLTNLSGEDEDKGRALRGLSFARAVTLSPYLYALNCSCLEEKHKPGFYKKYVENSPKIFYSLKCINTVKSWHEKRNEEISGQIIYMDAGKDNFSFIKEYLVKEIGYDPSQVQIISGGMSGDKKEKIKEQFLEGVVKIIIGTSTIKEGIDLQNKTTVLYNLWLDWRPTDVKQLEGRAWRFGNEFANVRIVTPLLENSVDPFMFQKLEEKTARINDIFDRHGRKNVLDLEEFNPEELKNGLISDPGKRAKEEIRQESKLHDIELKKLEAKISGISEILYIKQTMAGADKRLMNQVQWKYEYLMRHYSPYIEEIETVDEETGETKIVEKSFNASDYLREKFNISSAEDIGTIDQAIGFGRYYDRITKQTEFSYMIGEYRDAKKKLTNFEKSILQPRGLSLADDLDMVKDQMNTEADAIKEKVAVMNDPENINRRTEQIRKEFEEVERKRKSIDGRVNDFASLNDKVLSEKMEYETKQAAKVKDFKDTKTRDRKKKLAKAKAAQQGQRLRLLKLK